MPSGSEPPTDKLLKKIAAKIWTDVEDANDDATEGFLQIMQSDTLNRSIQILMLVLFNATWTKLRAVENWQDYFKKICYKRQIGCKMVFREENHAK